MSEEKGELTPKIETELESLPVSPLDVPLIAQLETRLVNANSPEDGLIWAQIRGEIISQDEAIKEGNHRRSLDKIQIFRRTGLSASALVIGTLLIMKGLTTVGMFILGAGLYELAPDLMRSSWPNKGKGVEDDNV